MEKIQENSKMLSKRFIIGIILIIASSIIGWVALFLCGVLAIKFGRMYAILGTILYASSWIPFGLGFLFAGSEGIKYAKGFFRKVFGKKDKKEERAG